MTFLLTPTNHCSKGAKRSVMNLAILITSKSVNQNNQFLAIWKLDYFSVTKHSWFIRVTRSVLFTYLPCLGDFLLLWHEYKVIHGRKFFPCCKIFHEKHSFCRRRRCSMFSSKSSCWKVLSLYDKIFPFYIKIIHKVRMTFKLKYSDKIKVSNACIIHCVDGAVSKQSAVSAHMVLIKI